MPRARNAVRHSGGNSTVEHSIILSAIDLNRSLRFEPCSIIYHQERVYFTAANSCDISLLTAQARQLYRSLPRHVRLVLRQTPLILRLVRLCYDVMH